MKVLVACEKSQVVCKAFRARGHEAFSCDVQPCSGGHPEWHIQGDVLNHLDEGWDLMIAHPECKYLCFSGERWAAWRMELRLQAFEFFKTIYNAPIKKKCIENSHSIFLNREFKKPTQSVHPYHFGDGFKKLTCLWLVNLKPLIPTNILWQRYPKAHRESPGPDRSERRARTYEGIANAMAQQWG
ncbi:MAG TPA: hypothetical protein VGK46_04680 [Saprospiraceae bacterium]